MGEAFIVNKTKILLEDPNAAPVYEFTGDSEWIWDDDINWRLKLTSSGILTFSGLGSAKSIDVFCVGAGGGSASKKRGGGGGGYTITQKGVSVERDIPYTITIGTGSIGANGGETSAFGVTASGGIGATVSGTGEAGGSGGGSYKWYASGGSGVGGSDGNNGAGGGTSTGGGKGQREQPGPNGETGSTREFGESTGDLYAGGGGGVITRGVNATYTSQAGGEGGGGASGSGGSGNTGSVSKAGTNGTDGLGGGGGGNNTQGGSGIVVIRNARS